MTTESRIPIEILTPLDEGIQIPDEMDLGCIMMLTKIRRAWGPLITASLEPTYYCCCWYILTYPPQTSNCIPADLEMVAEGLLGE